MIWANPYGGLGNQLFCYAFARAIQEESKDKKLYLFRSEFQRHYGKLHVPIEYFADYYKLAEDKVVVVSKLLPELAFLCCKAFFRCIFYFQDEGQLTIQQFEMRAKVGLIASRNIESLCGEMKKFPLTAPFKFVEGLFQWANAFLHIRDMLRTELTLKYPLNKDALDICKQINASESVCLHIRRGDYISHKTLHICNYDYYLQGMQYIAEHTINPTFFIFSDDIAWVRENYSIPYDHVFVDIRHDAPFELELMRNCKHFIMSNSTFSWWAQFLTSNENALVVAPYPWFTYRHPTALYLPNWHVIEVEGNAD